MEEQPVALQKRGPRQTWRGISDAKPGDDALMTTAQAKHSFTRTSKPI
jgi:hypothetical protein